MHAHATLRIASVTQVNVPSGSSLCRVSQLQDMSYYYCSHCTVTGSCCFRRIHQEQCTHRCLQASGFSEPQQAKQINELVHIYKCVLMPNTGSLWRLWPQSG